MRSIVYIAIIFSNYQELNLKRFVNHFKLKKKIILIRFLDENIKGYNFPKNVKKFTFDSKILYLVCFCYFLLKKLFVNKKFIFGNPESKFCTFIRKFVKGENQIYIDDGTLTFGYDYNKLKKNSSVLTIYRKKKFPSKIKALYIYNKYSKKIKKKSKDVLFIGSSLVADKLLNKNQFLEIMKINSLKEKKFYYFPHRREKKELTLLPNNFKIIKRKSSIEQFISSRNYNFKRIYSFGSSALVEIIGYYKTYDLRVFDFREHLVNSKHALDIKKRMDKYYKYLKKYKVKFYK